MSGRRVGYVVSRFPKTTETFIVREMEAVEREGWEVVPFAIRRESGEIVQPGARRYVDRLVAISDVDWPRLVRAQARLLRRDRRLWSRLWRTTIVGNARSPRFLLRGVMVAFGAPAIADEVVERELTHLHAHWATHSGLLAHLVAMLTGLPYSLTLHAHDLHVDRTMLETKLREATAIVTISEHNAELLRSEYPAFSDRVSVVHCGVDSRQVPFTLPGPLRQPVRLVCVAGLRPFKGHRHLIDAVGELERRGIAVRCDLVGDGPLRDELQQGAGANVTFHGATDVERAMEIVAGADLFVMPSVELSDGRRDGIPVALMEAMALGVPVIASAVSGIPELVRDGSTGILVEPGRPTAIADAVERLMGDVHLRRTIATKARRTIETKFDLTQSGRSMAALFEHDPVVAVTSDRSTVPASKAGLPARSHA
jgi:glycosyltransferase involved in cell wall biosynthesis